MSRSVRRNVMLLLVLALVASACGVFGDGDGDVGLTITADFQRTFNLFEGSRVRMAGIDIGSIEQVEVDEGADSVHVTMGLDPGAQVPAEAGAVVIQGALLGERYVQLTPTYDGGPTLEDGAHIPMDRTAVPVEFEEAFESLEAMLEGLDRQEVARLVTNLAETLDGQGDELGQTIDDVRDMIVALRQSDEQLVEMARTLSDLNATVATRADAMAQQFVDMNTVAEALASERADLDRALNALLRMARTVGDTVAAHRGNLTEDVATLTRLARTIDRNHEHYADFIKGQAELFRHTARGLAPRERNWAYVRNHYDAVPELIADRLTQRLIGVCLRLEIEECSSDEFWSGELPEGICLPPAVPCPEEEQEGEGEEGDGGDGGDEEGLEDIVPMSEALHEVFQNNPELRERLAEDRAGALLELERELGEDLDGDGVVASSEGDDDAAEERLEPSTRGFIGPGGAR